MSQLYKVLAADRWPYHGGKTAWPAPGEWLEVEGTIIPCQNGLHLCRELDLVHWLGPEIWLAEADGEVIDHSDKVVARRARLVSRIEAWTERTARLYAADCAERVLHLFERARPGDSRPRDAIAAARAYARGEIEDAAWAAARAAAWAAARAAARAAAEAAAWDAAEAAAWAAARAAAWDAAEAAAWAAARAAAEAAARAAAWAAEREWQTARLMAYLRGEVS